MKIPELETLPIQEAVIIAHAVQRHLIESEALYADVLPDSLTRQVLCRFESVEGLPVTAFEDWQRRFYAASVNAQISHRYADILDDMVSRGEQVLSRLRLIHVPR